MILKILIIVFVKETMVHVEGCLKRQITFKEFREFANSSACTASSNTKTVVIREARQYIALGVVASLFLNFHRSRF